MQVTLVPHKKLTTPPNYSVSVQVNWTGPHLSLEYEIKGDLNTLVLPPLNSKPKRLDELWKHTCFEAFLGLNNDPHYWELNISPSGDWNLYSFSNYRTGQSLETRIHKMNHEILESNSTCHRSKITLDVSNFLPETLIPIGLTAVIEHRDSSKTYWAIRHCSDQPDFHIRESFLIS